MLIMSVRAVRGAITVEENREQDIYSSTEELLNEILKANNIEIHDIISIFFTVTRDLTAAFPATAARKMGLSLVPLMCANEIEVSGSLKKCIRIMMHFNTSKGLDEIVHVYLKGAKILRQDLVK